MDQYLLKNELIKVFEKVKNVKNDIKNLTDKLECFEFNLNRLVIFLCFNSFYFISFSFIKLFTAVINISLL